MRKNKTNEQPQHKRTKMAKMKLVFNDDNDWVCAVCGLRYTAELILKTGRKWIECDECARHIITGTNLSPKQFRRRWCEEDEEDENKIAFICPKCT